MGNSLSSQKKEVVSVLGATHLHQQVNICVKLTYNFPSQMTSLLSAEVPVI